MLTALALLATLLTLALTLTLLLTTLPALTLLAAGLAVASLLLTALSLLTLARLGALTSTLLALLTLLPTGLIPIPRIARRLRCPRNLLDLAADLFRAVQCLLRRNLTAIVAAPLALLVARRRFELFHLIFQLV